MIRKTKLFFMSSQLIRQFYTHLTLIGFVSLGVPHARTANAQDGLTVYDVARIQAVTSVKISPDGKWIAYTLSVPRRPMKDEDGPAWIELHVVDTKGASRPFVTGEVNVSAMDWTPDGKGISFLAKRQKDDHTSLYLIPIDGGEAARVVNHSTAIASYSWKPDGKHIAFLAKEPEDEEKEKFAKKGFKAEIYEEDLRNVKIWITSVDPSSNATPKVLSINGSASDLHWSPDGKRLLAAIAPSSLIDHYYMYRRLKVIDPGSGDVLASIENPGKLGPARWSPDGEYIAFCSARDVHDPSAGRLMIASADSGAFKEILTDYTPNISSIEWKDRSTVLFSANDGCNTALGSVSRDGLVRDSVIRSGGPIFSEFSIHNDEARVAFAASSPKHPDEVFLLKQGSDRPSRLTNHNEWLDEKRLAKQEVIRYQARDGETIEGVLIHPLDEHADQRYPLILTVHGGPESQIPNGWLTRYSYPGQVGAARGFAVFYPNYRGSTGRGVAFAKAHQSDYAGKEFDDLIDGVDHLIATGLVDKDKVGVTGGSYGGFASAWCATYHTKRFAASVMFVGISDLISKFGTTDIPDEMNLVHARKQPWEDWQFFLKRSPIYYVEQARTPILILHGKDDPRVHPSQSLELYRNLKVLGKTPVRFIYYPGEGHGNKKAAAQLDYSMRMFRWMEHYLMSPGGDPPANELDYGLEEEDD